jgi:hypothetical protein
MLLPGLCDPRWCVVEGSNKERWLQLAELAAKEQDPVKLIELVEEIDRALEEKKQRLKVVLQEKEQRLKVCPDRGRRAGSEIQTASSTVKPAS